MKSHLLMTIGITCFLSGMVKIDSVQAIDQPLAIGHGAIATNLAPLPNPLSDLLKSQPESPHDRSDDLQSLEQNDTDRHGTEHQDTDHQSEEGQITPAEHGEHEHGEHDHEGHHGGLEHDVEAHHGSLEVTDTNQIPQVTVILHPDVKSGWNVEVQTENFTFAPERVNQANHPNEGHAHLYVDGVKITRLYGPWYYLEHLEPGLREITVSLHANGHEAWTYEGEAIANTITISVPAISE